MLKNPTLDSSSENRDIPTGNISPSDIIQEVNSTIQQLQPIPHDVLLENLLTKIKPVDFKGIVYPKSIPFSKKRIELLEKLTKEKRRKKAREKAISVEITDNTDAVTDNILQEIKEVDTIAEVINNTDATADNVLQETTEEGDTITEIIKNAETPEVDSILQELKKVDSELAKFKVSQKHYKVIVVEKILKLARQLNWGLCKRHDFIYLYNGEYWKLLDKDILAHFLGEAALRMKVIEWDAKDEAFVTKLYSQFIYASHLPEPSEEETSTLVNLQNGTFEITPKTQQLRNFARKDFLTYQLPFKYNPKAKAPLFEKYLNTVLPDTESQTVLAEYLGYVFTRHLKLEKTLLLYGSGANGKSVFFDITNALLGEENVSNYSLQSLTDDKGYHRAKIANSLVNYASEINGKLQTDIFKQLVSGEPVEARLPYGQPFVMKHYARLIFNCNTLPTDVELTNAYFRRFLIIPFDVTIPLEQQDSELAKKIIDNELSGVFNWAMKGLERILEQKKFSKCAASQAQVDSYKMDSDSIQLFLEEEGYIPSIEDDEPYKDIYAMYKSSALDSMLRPVSKKAFSRRMKKLGFTIERKNFGNAIYIERKK